MKFRFNRELKNISKKTKIENVTVIKSYICNLIFT